MSRAEAYAGRSFWLETAGEDLTPRPALDGSVTVDVAILGGGYSGLWTAYYLLRDNPGLEVAILERDICGFGASGRNGAWCSSRFPLDPGALERRYGADVARETLLSAYDAVAEVGRVCEREGIEAEFRINGILSLARGEAQLPAIRASHAAYERLGFGDRNRLLDADAAREKIRVSDLCGALHTPFSGAVHPAKLARGLARVVERLGGAIYERTEVVRVEPGSRPRLVSPLGAVTARKGVIAAGEAYLSGLPRFRRAILPMSSTIILTEPLSEAQWARIGWAGGEGLGSQVATVDYLTRTTDGRILYGSRGAVYRYGSRMDEGVEPGLAERMTAVLRRWFEPLADTPISHVWSGYLGVARDWTPSVGFDPAQGLGWLYGYTGRGVATTNMAGRLLADLVVGRPSPLSTSPIAGRRSPSWEPEPLRWLGVRYLQDAYRRLDAAAAAGRPPPFDAPLARRLGRQ